VYYRGGRKTVPSAVYGGYTELLEVMGWDWWTLQEQPADLVDELMVKLSARNRVSEERANKAAKGTHGKRR